MEAPFSTIPHSHRARQRGGHPGNKYAALLSGGRKWRRVHLHKHNWSRSQNVWFCCWKFDSFFNVQRNVSYEHAQFNQRDQLEGESAEQYITCLYSLIETCEYGTFRKEKLQGLTCCGDKGCSNVAKTPDGCRTYLGEGEKSHLPKRGCIQTTTRAAMRRQCKRPHSRQWGQTYPLGEVKRHRVIQATGHNPKESMNLYQAGCQHHCCQNLTNSLPSLRHLGDIISTNYPLAPPVLLNYFKGEWVQSLRVWKESFA